MAGVNKEQIKAFWSKVDILNDKNECWNWSGAKTPKGYGNVRINKSYKKAHRVSWELINFPIPSGFVIMHICDNPSCCNPNHLAMSRPLTNNIDMLIKNRGEFHKNKAIGKRNCNAKLTDEKVREIRRKYDAREYDQYELAEIYGVSQPAIGCIVRNKTWRHV